MNASTKDPLKVIHGVAQVDKLVKQPYVILSSTIENSVNSTLPIAIVNAWLQFSLAYVAAIIITSNDLSFITAIFNPTLMSAYALVSVILGAVLLTSLALKYMNREEIEESLIDVKIRGGKGKISKIAKEAKEIEIITNLGSEGTKFSIIMPISKTQENILDGQIKENRNRVILLTIPYVISAAVIIGALVQNKFSLANVLGWGEWSFIAFVSTITIVGICIAFYKLRNNEKNEKYDFVKKFDNLDVLLPFLWRKVSIFSVMKEQATDQEENGPVSQLIEIVREFKDEFISLFASRLDTVCNSFDIFLDKATNLLDKKLLEPANANIEETLDHLKGIREDIKTNLTTLHEEISIVLDGAEKFMEKVNSLDIKGTFSELQSAVKTAKDKIEQFQPSRLMGYFQQNTQSSNEFLGMVESSRKEVEELETANEKLKKSLKDAKTQVEKRNIRCGTSCGSETVAAADPLETQVKAQRKEVRHLRLQKESNELAAEQERLEKELEELPKQKKWKEKINGPASEFLRYVLESVGVKLGKEKQTLDGLKGKKIVIHWKDGSCSTCHFDEEGKFTVEPNTEFSFIDPNTQAGFAVACAG